MKKEKRKPNAALLNVIAPMNLDFAHTSMQIGENTAKGYGIIRYATDNPYGWLSRITNLPNSIVSITYQPLDSGEMIGIMDSNISAARKRIVDAKKASEETRAEKEIKQKTVGGD